MNSLMASASLASMILRAPDDGAGAASGTDATGANTGAAGTGAGDTTGTALRDASTGAAVGDTRDDSYDGLRDRVRALEDEVLDLKTRPVPVEHDAGPSAVVTDRFERLEHVLSTVFGREFANYDSQRASGARA